MESISETAEWVNNTPYNPRQAAVFQAWEAFRNTVDKRQPKFRRFRRSSKTIKFQKSNWSNNCFYPRQTQGLTYRATEELPAQMPTNPSLNYQNGRWYICYAYEVPKDDLGITDAIALDPGVRTFLTGYDGQKFLEFGKGDFGRIARLCKHLDNLISKRVTSRGHKLKHYRYKLRKAERQLRSKIKDLVDELHKKVASYLTQHYGIIFLPTFETSQMVNRIRRRIGSKTARAMLTWAHFRFKQTLKHQASQRGCIVVDVTEEYTSKTCSKCGHVHTRLGGNKIFKCPECGHQVGRDYNGAFNIMLKALLDTALIVEFIDL